MFVYGITIFNCVSNLSTKKVPVQDSGSSSPVQGPGLLPIPGPPCAGPHCTGNPRYVNFVACTISKHVVGIELKYLLVYVVNV